MLGCTQESLSILMKENYLLTGKMKENTWDLDLEEMSDWFPRGWGSGLSSLDWLCDLDRSLSLWVSNPHVENESWSEWTLSVPEVPTFCVYAFQSPVLVTLTLTFQSPMLVTLINALVQISHTDAVSIYIVTTHSYLWSTTSLLPAPFWMHGPISVTFTIAVSNGCYLCFIDEEFEAEDQVASKEAWCSNPVCPTPRSHALT